MLNGNEVMLALLDSSLGHRSEYNLNILQGAADELRPVVEAARTEEQAAAAKEAAAEQAAADEAIAKVRAQYAAEQAAAEAAKAAVKAKAPAQAVPNATN